MLADETRVEQVVVNLVSNALKYALTGEIKISGRLHPGQVVICVSDEGPGIEAKDLPHIFDRFYRANDANGSGTGLGLSLAKGAVEALGGHLTLAATGADGTSFRISIPR